MEISDTVQQAVAAAFPDDDRPAVLAALRGYQWGEPTRVQLAILALADGDLDKVENLVEHANGDYRDVLYWAEYPEESGTGTKSKMAERYRRLGVKVPSDLH
jgi:hypothetical protein